MRSSTKDLPERNIRHTIQVNPDGSILQQSSNAIVTKSGTGIFFVRFQGIRALRSATGIIFNGGGFVGCNLVQPNAVQVFTWNSTTVAAFDLGYILTVDGIAA